MSASGIPLSCGTMDETTGCSDCSLLPIEFLDVSLAKVLGADLNSAIAFFLMLLMVIIILKEIVGLFVIAFVIFAQEKSVRDFNFVEIARDSIVGLVLIFILSIIDFSYLGRALTSDNDDDSQNSSRLVEPYPKIMRYVWMPLEYFELFVELIFSILWIQNLYSDAFYDIPKGREVDVILMSWAFAMFDLFMFRVPMLVNNMLCGCFSCCNKKKTDSESSSSSSSKTWNVFMFSLYVSLALIGTVVYIVMYNLRYDYCWEMDDGVSTQGIRNDLWRVFCESSWTWCSYVDEGEAYWAWYSYDVEVPMSTGFEEFP